MRGIIKMTIKDMIKQPFYYIGLILCCCYVYVNLCQYLNVQYFENDSQIVTLDENSISDADIMNGYIPVNDNEKEQLALSTIYKNLVEELDVEPNEAKEVIKEYKQGISIDDFANYLDESYGYKSAEYAFYDANMKQATIEEANNYVREKLGEENYTEWFSKKFVDYFGVCLIFFMIALFPILYMKDCKRDIYELIHTKSISSIKYIGGKAIAGFLAMIPVILVITLFYNFLAMKISYKWGFNSSMFDIFKYVIIFILPSVVMALAIHSLVTVIFKNPLPTIPIMILYILYSNIGAEILEGNIHYKTHPLSIFIRFPEIFFETKISLGMYINQISLLIVSILIFMIATVVWKRRRF